MQCQHFYVTWDTRFPRGCRVYGFKTRQLPSVEVFRASGMKCLKFEKKGS
nr:uracil-DNA glycosylase [Bacillus oleivorans]